MLHQKDYILRLIEQFGRAVAQLLDRILNRPLDELAEVDAELNALAHRVGMDLELAHRLDPQSLRLLVSPGGSVDPGRCWLLAELLYLHGRKAERQGDAGRARQSLERALHLFRLVDPGWTPAAELPDARDRVRELEAHLDGRREPDALRP